MGRNFPRKRSSHQSSVTIGKPNKQQISKAKQELSHLSLRKQQLNVPFVPISILLLHRVGNDAMTTVMVNPMQDGE